jgi:hypothetical protein
MFVHHSSGVVASVAHEGETFAPDEAGVFDVPALLAARLLLTPGWSVPEGIVVDRRQGHETYPPEPEGEAVKTEPEPKTAKATKAATEPTTPPAE